MRSRLKNPELAALVERYQQENANRQTTQFPKIPDDATQVLPHIPPQMNMNFIINKRRVIYKGLNGQTFSVVGPEVLQVSGAGVTLVAPDAPYGIVRLIPWWRVLELDSHPADPIRNGRF